MKPGSINMASHLVISAEVIKVGENILREEIHIAKPDSLHRTYTMR